ncbi:T9SS type A sorting domain-containing protein [bacterium SCSIO 12643]|nr:T9SS type A sorting domain-containing protein [bacterium SCSIO 12643]
MKLKHKFTFIVLLLSTISVNAQHLFKYTRNDSIEVEKAGTVFKNAWAGGMNNPQLNHMDVNFDCVKDIVIFDRSSNAVRVYLNDNISDDPSYTYAPEYARFFPDDLKNFMLLRDYNHDGKEDIFTSRILGFRVYRNVSDTALKFVEMTDYLKSNTNGEPTSAVYVLPVDYPCIDDIDSDGDLDILNFNQAATEPYFYENITPSNNLDTIILESDKSCWGKFHEDHMTDSLVLNSYCGGRVSGNPGSGNVARHPGATLTTLDLFGNGLKDVLLGDVGYNNLVMLRNGGDIDEAYMTTVNYHYPDPYPVDMPTFPASFFLDVDNNSRNDLVVAPNERDNGMDTGNVWYYKNFGANNHPNFQLQKKNFLVGEQVDVGTMALPVLADISGDQIPDLIIGNIGYFENYDPYNFITTYNSRITYYRNNGTATNPSFEFVTDDLAGISSTGFTRIAPAIADLDGDGDNDMIFAENNGALSFYRNIAPPNQEADFVLVEDTFMGQLFGIQPTPFLFDVDGDNAKDLLVGQHNGNIRLYLNQGDSTNPIYTLSATDTLGGIFNYYPGYKSNAVPFIGKIDGGTNNILVIADGDGNLMYYDGLDNNFMGNFTLIDSMKVSNSMIGVTGANLDGSDSLELIVGERTGGLMYLNMDAVGYAYSPYPRDTCPPIIDDIEDLHKNNGNDLSIYPNPNDGTFKVKIQVQKSGAGTLTIVDMAGRRVVRQVINLSKGLNEIDISGTGVQNGVYIVQIQVGGQLLREKLIVR